MFARWIISGLLFAAMATFAAAPRASAQDVRLPSVVVDESPEGRRELTRREVLDEPEVAESEDEIETDRDSFTPAVTTAGGRRVILESAYSFLDNRVEHDTHSLPELLVRVGVADWLELRLGWNYEVGGEGSSVSGGGGFGEDFESGTIEEESQVSYGAKVRLFEQRDWRPALAWIAMGATPTAGPDPETQMMTGIIGGWDFADGWKWDSAMRYSFDATADDHFNLWAPSTVLKKSFAERWSGHVEYFGLFEDGKEHDKRKHYFSPGLHYLLTPDFEVGFRVGWGLNQDATRFFANIGAGLRF